MGEEEERKRGRKEERKRRGESEWHASVFGAKIYKRRQPHSTFQFTSELKRRLDKYQENQANKMPMKARHTKMFFDDKVHYIIHIHLEASK